MYQLNKVRERGISLLEVGVLLSTAALVTLLAVGIRYNKHLKQNLEPTAVYGKSKTQYRDLNGNGKYETLLTVQEMPIAQIERDEKGDIVVKPFSKQEITDYLYSDIITNR